MKRNEYPIHPDFRAWKHMNPPLNKVMLPAIQGLLRPLFDRERSSGDMAVERKTIPVGGGASIRALLYAPRGLEGSAPCLVDYHGGGFVLPAALSLLFDFAARRLHWVKDGDMKLDLRESKQRENAPDGTKTAGAFLIRYGRRCREKSDDMVLQSLIQG